METRSHPRHDIREERLYCTRVFMSVSSPISEVTGTYKATNESKIRVIRTHIRILSRVIGIRKYPTTNIIKTPRHTAISISNSVLPGLNYDCLIGSAYIQATSAGCAISAYLHVGQILPDSSCQNRSSGTIGSTASMLASDLLWRRLTGMLEYAGGFRVRPAVGAAN